LVGLMPRDGLKDVRTDALVTSDAVRFAALPPDSPLAMPEQSLWKKPGGTSPPETAPSDVPLRRIFVLGATVAMTLVAAREIYEVLKVGGITVPEGFVMGLFLLLFAWIAFSFVSTVIGFVALLGGPNRTLAIDAATPLPDIGSRNALLLPTYNEDPQRVMARLQAIYESIEATGHGAQVDYYILSDTTDPAVWIAEEAAFLQLRERTSNPRIYYRHRVRNIGRKAGNIAEWIARFGGRYDHMVVLDADSLMSGDTVVRLAAAMAANPRVGLIQTLPIMLNGQTLFARIQQFAGRVYGPPIARGITWWHGSEGNYWGHNAIIRVQAFAEQAGLPLLRGPKPFGGHVLSHDFVEAALMRRAGWGVHMAPSLGGSYEECPPSITDYAVRDRRWCQGNLQHLGVLPARGLHWVSRLHLLTGIGSYITAPLWLLFLLTGILISLQAQFVRPEYFPEGATLFPQWPAQDPVRAAWVFAGTMALLIVPKLLGYLALLPRKRERQGIGGGVRAFISVILETFISALVAPIMMLMQSKAVIEILIGRDSGWQAQRRDDGKLSGAELLRHYLWPTALGVALAAGAYAVSVPLFLWMMPVVAGLVLSIPIVAVTSLPIVGRGLRSLGLLLTPEEREPPEVLVRATEIAVGGFPDGAAAPFARLAQDPALLDAHRQMIPARETRRRGDIDVHLVVALAKIDEAETRDEAVALLNAKETSAVLANNAALDRLLAKPPGVSSHG
jgi:membrane glycosyltransferase